MITNEIQWDTARKLKNKYTRKAMIDALVSTGDYTRESLKTKQHVPISRIIASDYPNLRIGVTSKPALSTNAPVYTASVGPEMSNFKIDEVVPMTFAKLAGIGFALVLVTTIFFTLVR